MILELWLLISCIFVSVTCSPSVTIEQGEVIGTYEKLSNGRILHAFKGIPYAKPPLGKLRFKVCLTIAWVNFALKILYIFMLFAGTSAT